MELGMLDHVEQRGELKGRRETLREQIEIRFGPLSPEVMANLEALPRERLIELARALFSAASLDELGLGAPESTPS